MEKTQELERYIICNGVKLTNIEEIRPLEIEMILNSYDNEDYEGTITIADSFLLYNDKVLNTIAKRYRHLARLKLLEKEGWKETEVAHCVSRFEKDGVPHYYEVFSKGKFTKIDVDKAISLIIEASNLEDKEERLSTFDELFRGNKYYQKLSLELYMLIKHALYSNKYYNVKDELYYQELYKQHIKLIHPEYELTRRESINNKFPDAWLKDCKNEFIPMEMKKDKFNNKALKQLLGYMNTYKCDKGIAIGRTLDVDLPDNIEFVSLEKIINISHNCIEKGTVLFKENKYEALYDNETGLYYYLINNKKYYNIEYIATKMGYKYPSEKASDVETEYKDKVLNGTIEYAEKVKVYLCDEEVLSNIQSTVFSKKLALA